MGPTAFNARDEVAADGVADGVAEGTAADPDLDEVTFLEDNRIDTDARRQAQALSSADRGVCEREKKNHNHTATASI